MFRALEMSYNSRLALRNHAEKNSSTSLNMEKRDQCQNRKSWEYLTKIDFTRLRYNIHIFFMITILIFITILIYMSCFVLPSIKKNFLAQNLLFETIKYVNTERYYFLEYGDDTLFFLSSQVY